jgi:hypothetical protein
MQLYIIHIVCIQILEMMRIKAVQTFTNLF